MVSSPRGWCLLLTIASCACSSAGSSRFNEPPGAKTGAAVGGATASAGGANGLGTGSVPGASGASFAGHSSGGASVGAAAGAATGGATAVGGSASGMTALAGASGKFAPPDGSTLLVVGQDTQSMQDYIAAEGTMPGGVMIYSSITDLNGITYPSSYGAGEDNFGYWAGRPEKFVIQIGLNLQNALNDIPNGGSDANIDTLADTLSAAKRPIFLRLGYEFDADWTNYEPNLYQSAFRHIVDRIRGRGATNVVFVWHSWGYYHSYGQARADAWYPGDSYVDWVGVSMFPGWDDASNGSALQVHAELSQFAKAHNKPFLIAESAPKQVFEPSRGMDSWNGWYQPLFDFIKANDVKLFSYINADWDTQPMWAGKGWGDSRVQSNDYVLQRWRQTTGNPAFVQSSQALY